MKYFIYSLFFILVSCSTSNKESEKISINKRDIITKNIHVKGMTCVGCEVTLEKAISKVKGVVSVKASASENKAIIAFDSTKTNIKKLTTTIEKEGYKTLKYN